MFPGGFRKERNPRESFRHCVLQLSFSRGLVSENGTFAVFQADLKEIGAAAENFLSGETFQRFDTFGKMDSADTVSG